MNNDDSFVIVTAVSAGGKTSLKDELVERGWKSAINFTTREPRSEREKDDYVFIDRKTFFKKLANGDFIEHTSFNGNEYAVSRFLPKGNVVTVLDPVGRNQIMEKWARAGIKVTTVFLDINEEVQAERLNERHISVNELEARQRDFNWFDKTKFCLSIDGTLDVKEIADIVEEETLFLDNETGAL